jgi:hypothetical protein
VLENRVLGKVLGPKRDEVTEDWRKLRSVTKSYSGENIKDSGVGRGVRHVWGRGEVHRVLVQRPGGRNHLEDLSVDGRIIPYLLA